jgi:hypothetical protein
VSGKQRGPDSERHGQSADPSYVHRPRTHAHLHTLAMTDPSAASRICVVRVDN